MDRIVIDNIVRDYILKLNELENNEKYLAMLILNKISYSYLFLNKDKKKKEFVKKSLESITKKITGKKETTNKIVKVMVENKLVERGTSYQAGVTSKGFKPLFELGGRLSTIKAEDYLSSAQLSNLRAREEASKDYEIQWHQENILKNVELDLMRVLILVEQVFGMKFMVEASCLATFCEGLVGLETIKDYLMLLDLKKKSESEKEYERKIMIRNKLLELMSLENTKIIKGEKGGRHYHVLSNAPKIVKSCMVSKDPLKPFLAQIDIKNSQPFFLLALLTKNKYEVENSIKTNIVGGTFYELIGEALGYWYEDVQNVSSVRSEVKRIVFRDIFFCKTNGARANNSTYKKVKELYPLFCSGIEKLTEKNKQRTLASLLQEIESQEVLPITKKHKGFGVHDSVLVVSTENFEEVQAIAMELEMKLFKKYKIKASTSIETISERTSENPMVAGTQQLLFENEFKK